MDVLACVCTAIATAIAIFVTEAIWQMRRSAPTVTNTESSSSSNIPEKKSYLSAGVQVPESDGLDTFARAEHIETSSNSTGQDIIRDKLNEKMGEKDNLAKLEVVTNEFTETDEVVNSGKQSVPDIVNKKGYNINTENSNVFFTFENTDLLSTKEEIQNNVDVVADNNRNHETEIKCLPKQRIRRMSDVIDSVGESLNAEKVGHSFSRKSSSSSPPATPPSDAGYSSVHSTPSHTTKITKSTPCKRNDTVDAGCNITAKYEYEHTDTTSADENETIDAGPIQAQPEDITEMIVGGPVVEAHMPVAKYADEYNMNHPRRGRAVIFNNDTFDTPGVSNRAGSDVDVKNLDRLFTKLDFEITVHNNKEYSEIKKILHDLSQEDHSDADCILVTVLTHGIRDGYIHSKDVPFYVDYLWKPFTADKCTSLAGKPKIFFVQACRGEGLDSGVNLVRNRTQTDSVQESYKIPTHSDFLIAYSSAEGFYSWRNPESGTWFIQCLCKELSELAATTDLLKILTRTARRVALDYESINDAALWQHMKKQVPAITTMLIRDVYFRSKK